MSTATNFIDGPEFAVGDVVILAPGAVIEGIKYRESPVDASNATHTITEGTPSASGLTFSVCSVSRPIIPSSSHGYLVTDFSYGLSTTLTNTTGYTVPTDGKKITYPPLIPHNSLRKTPTSTLPEKKLLKSSISSTTSPVYWVAYDIMDKRGAEPLVRKGEQVRLLSDATTKTMGNVSVISPDNAFYKVVVVVQTPKPYEWRSGHVLSGEHILKAPN